MFRESNSHRHSRTQIFLAVILVVRLRSMWHGEEPRWMLPLVYSVLTWIIVMRVVGSSGMRGQNVPAALLVRHYPLCIPVRAPRWRHAGWYGAAVFDLLIYALTLYRMRELSRSLSRNSAALFQLRNFIWTSSTLYFAISFTSDVICASVLLFARNAVLPAIPLMLSQFCNTVIACRIVFHSDLFSEGKTGLLVIQQRYREASKNRESKKQSDGTTSGGQTHDDDTGLSEKSAPEFSDTERVCSSWKPAHETSRGLQPSASDGTPFEDHASLIFPTLMKRSHSEDIKRERERQTSREHSNIDHPLAAQQEVLTETFADCVNRLESATLRRPPPARPRNDSYNSACMTQETTVEVAYAGEGQPSALSTSPSSNLSAPTSAANHRSRTGLMP